MTAAHSTFRTTTRVVAGLVLPFALAIAGVAASTAGSATPRRPAFDGAQANAVVRARPGHELAAEALVAKLGGAVHTRLKIIGGFSASLPASAVPALRRRAAVLSVAPNRELRPESSSYSAASYDPNTDGYSMSEITKLSGARDWWKAGYTGKGVDVALIDTGVSPVQGLSSYGKLLNGPDLSLESQASNLRYLDTFGHGTFMAGLIAGRDAAPDSQAPASTYLGMAPDARIVSLKVGSADGGTDVAQVIAAIDWVVQHAHDSGLNIRVLNLSYGTNSTQDYADDPLAFAAEQAWKHGIVVVAAGGNDGYQKKKNVPALADPAIDPFLLAIGSADTNGSQTLRDDQVPSFSPWPKKPGPRTVDLIAPGMHMQGLRVPNSFIDSNYPKGKLSGRYFRGSGTSESTAVTTGAVALILEKYPAATPDQVKKLLLNNAVPISGKPQAIGAGELQLGSLNGSLPNWTQKYAPSNGKGSLEASRGSDHLTRNGVVLSGEKDIFGMPVDTTKLAAGEMAGNTWSGGNWNGSTWTGNSWSGNSWSSTAWSGNSWSGSSWSSGTWSGSTWSGSSWSSTDWSGNSWSGSSWSGGSWAGDSWE
jgi:serine protease AprX